MGDVHGDFHAPSEIERCRCFPFHDAAPKILVESGQGPFDKAPSKDVTFAGSLGRRHLPQCRGRPKPDHHETDLMIFMSPLRAGAAGL
jgi:hypothetical protein